MLRRTVYSIFKIVVFAIIFSFFFSINILLFFSFIRIVFLYSQILQELLNDSYINVSFAVLILIESIERQNLAFFILKVLIIETIVLEHIIPEIEDNLTNE